MFISLKIKIISIITLFFAIVLFFNMLYSFSNAKEQLNNYLNNLNTTSAKILTNTIRGDLYNLNYSKVKNTINSFENEYFKDIYVLNKDGYIFAQKSEKEIKYRKYENIKKEFIYSKKILIANKTLGYIIIENNDKIFEQLKKEKKNEIIKLFIILLLLTIVISYFISMIITKPIDKILKNIKNINENEDFKFQHSNDEYGYLSKVIEKSHKNIQNLNKNLENLVEKEISKNIEKDKILQEQSLRASLGGMMDAVAHQWMQPLGVIRLISQDLNIKSDLNTLEKNDISCAYKKTSLQINHMIDTLDEFRSFFRVDKQLEYIDFDKIVDSTLFLLKDIITINKIDITYNLEYKNKLHIIPNEFKQILINLINNAKDAFISNNIQNRAIHIDAQEKDSKIQITLQDNAGGISNDIIDKVFDINFTSKKATKGTGIGLYISKLIIHKINGEIEVINKKEGACFIITLDK